VVVLLPIFTVRFVYLTVSERFAPLRLLKHVLYVISCDLIPRFILLSPNVCRSRDQVLVLVLVLATVEFQPKTHP
jgi:hypothetical protein